MIISIDYDGTWTKSPQLWIDFVNNGKKKRHSFVCITSRSPDTPDKKLKNSIGKHMPIVYAAGNAKSKVAKKKGYSVDVWIDDNPDTINNVAENIEGNFHYKC